MNTDPFLNDRTSTKRLIKDYFTHGKLIIAYDFDSTVFDFHKEGHTFKLVKQLIRDTKDYAEFIVFTHSNDDRHDFIREYLDKEDLPYNTINEGLVWANGKKEGKLFFSHLLDDRAGLKSAYLVLLDFLRVMETNPETIADAYKLIDKK